jgi:hypothetical protein
VDFVINEGHLRDYVHIKIYSRDTTPGSSKNTLVPISQNDLQQHEFYVFEINAKRPAY